MKIVKNIDEIRKDISLEKANNKKIAFVPTMGALHYGHLSLIKKARKIADIVVVSIFVNKAQFNDVSDYEKYPRQFESDFEQLKSENVDYVFAPDQEKIYCDDFSFKLQPTRLIDCLCGYSRIGHFDGVALIITKLFNIIRPNFAIFGEKDFQQFVVIKALARDLNFDIEIISGEIIREKDGLAMSSRNQLLSADARKKSALVFKILSEIKAQIKNNENHNLDISLMLEEKKKILLQNNFDKIDYLEIRNESNLQIVKNIAEINNARIFIAVYLDKIRLIDNLII